MTAYICAECLERGHDVVVLAKCRGERHTTAVEAGAEMRDVRRDADVIIRFKGNHIRECRRASTAVQRAIQVRALLELFGLGRCG